jgi:two-component system, NtrC family, sensor kinase
MRALGEAVAHLPWLAPRAASLLALARAPAPTAWEEMRLDPGAVLLVVRRTAAAALASGPAALSPARLEDPAVLHGALSLLEASAGPPTAGFVDWTQPGLRPVYQFSLNGARLAERAARVTGQCHPEAAWAAGLLAPLGWLAAAALDPTRTAACLNDPELAANPVATQERHWGLDQAAIARRLVRRWGLPDWLAVVIGQLGLPVALAEALGADADLFLVTQLAVGLVQQQGVGLYLPVGASLAEVAAALGLSAGDRNALEAAAEELCHNPTLTPPWTDPGGVPLLRDLLVLAAENRRLRDAPLLEPLERQFDQVQQALEEQRAAERQRLQAQKLTALAEFAAGAGHEINNPLAVISGQAQYLLKKIADCRLPIADGSEQSAICNLQSAMEGSLQTVIGQTQRIHQLLNELMQFARPPRPQKDLVDVPALIQDVAAELREPAVQRGVQLNCSGPTQPVSLYADVRQIRTALTCLLRNAIEAAPAGGWAGIRLERPAADRVEFVVEDSGSGPVQRDHLFDPFYSGRSAGRGRGLGLPTAWRLAREHGGDVRFDERSTGPTRFILSLPCEKETLSPGKIEHLPLTGGCTAA